MEKEEENIALVGKEKVKKGPNQGHGSKGEKKKKEMSKVKCFGCDEFGHYVTQCSKRKKDKKGALVAASTKINHLSAKFEDEFAMFVTLSSDGGGV